MPHKAKKVKLDHPINKRGSAWNMERAPEKELCYRPHGMAIGYRLTCSRRTKMVAFMESGRSAEDW
jgi:hypothetical protein